VPLSFLRIAILVKLKKPPFAILGRVEGYLNNMFENTTKKKLAA
jgi:hypothetical protein